jgi:hypothetical protein
MSTSNKNISFKTIAPFLNNGNQTARLLSYAGLMIGVLLLLCCVQMYINLNVLLEGKNPSKDGFDFISVTKEITNDNMGKQNNFSDAEIADFKKQTFITDVAPMLTNQFKARASAGDLVPFSTDLFFESIQDDFIDTLPDSFSWAVGQADVPVIFSADFLESYNVFALAQGLPQLSESSIGAVSITLECFAADGSAKNFKGHIVAVSDRINSVIVPKTFLDWGNKFLSGTNPIPPSRIYVKTVDANSAALQNYLQQKGYHVNKDKTKFGRIKTILQTIIASLGGLAVLVVLLSILLFSFYLQLMISRSKDNLKLLINLGYSPIWLSKTVTKNWIIQYAFVIFLAVVFTFIFQYLFQQNFVMAAGMLSPYVHVYVLALAVLLFFICIFTCYCLVKKQLLKI